MRQEGFWPPAEGLLAAHRAGAHWPKAGHPRGDQQGTEGALLGFPQKGHAVPSCPLNVKEQQQEAEDR